jgi:long-chain acyl-CoA synthetase
VNVKNKYEERVWCKCYPPEIPAEIEIPSKSVNEFFDEATDKWKNETAIIFYGKKISYGELRDKVDRFANALSNLGIMKGDRVALLLLNSPEFVITLYGIFKVGAIATPISPVYVSSEIKHQLEDSGAETIVCQDMLYEGVEKTGIKMKNVILTNISESLPTLSRFIGKSVLRGVYQKMAIPPSNIFEQEGFYQFQDLLNRYQPSPPEVRITPEDTISLQYTGGTTGPPKGVITMHYNMVACMTLYNTFFPFLEKGKEILICYMPFYHKGGQFMGPIWGIINGAKLIVITTPDPDDILNAVTRHKATCFFGAPSIYEILKDYEKTDRVDWKKLKACISTADTLNEATFQSWKNRTGVTLHDYFAATEACFCIANPLGRGKAGSIGIPVNNTIGAIADPDEDKFLPVGEMGEIVVRGPQVTKGYWNKPEATKECEMIIDGLRWWRTGDLAKMEEDGYFYIYDRKKDLIKYKGLSVFAREVEEILKTHPKIRDVGVIGVPDIKVGQNVKALIVLEADARGKLSEADIINYCQGKLAHYKIPKLVEFVGEIPKTDVGKVSRRELRESEF